jgi:hypothetical protein
MNILLATRMVSKNARRYRITVFDDRVWVELHAPAAGSARHWEVTRSPHLDKPLSDYFTFTEAERLERRAFAVYDSRGRWNAACLHQLLNAFERGMLALAVG